MGCDDGDGYEETKAPRPDLISQDWPMPVGGKEDAKVALDVYYERDLVESADANNVLLLYKVLRLAVQLMLVQHELIGEPVSDEAEPMEIDLVEHCHAAGAKATVIAKVKLTIYTRLDTARATRWFERHFEELVEHMARQLDLDAQHPRVTPDLHRHFAMDYRERSRSSFNIALSVLGLYHGVLSED